MECGKEREREREREKERGRYLPPEKLHVEIVGRFEAGVRDLHRPMGEKESLYRI